ncbi:hypothetical protein [Blastochloris sulfoviridis]|uniref:Uncharacterized protein n=1 Tax=Blastochloris sulfoviridis TaxID=50712 RepID=A0A5M6I2X1_9HYPH|nr:hypothetical protein [Blastochloris sulfoviridis]KAA5602550.1 hypothetical protein F1193_05145 [Blastochloris sulfoviridis]
MLLISLFQTKRIMLPKSAPFQAAHSRVISLCSLNNYSYFANVGGAAMVWNISSIRKAGIRNGGSMPADRRHKAKDGD